MIARSPLPLRVLSLAAAVLLASCGGDGGGGTDVPVPTTMLKTAGDNQTGSPGTALPEPLEVKVTDDRGQAVPDFTVSFSTTAGSLSPQSMDTDTDGRARTSLTLPNQSGTVTVTASAASVPSVSFTAEVVAGQLGFVTSVLPAGRTTIPYGRAIEVTGGTGSGYTFEITQGSLPSGMVLENDGSFSGAPTQTGAFPITVRVTDAEGTTASRAFTLNTCSLPADLDIGEVRVVDPGPFGECGTWIPNDGASRYYRVAVVRTNRTGETGGEREVTLTVTGNGVTAAASPPGAFRSAPGAPAPDVARRLTALPALAAKQEATARLHGRLFAEGDAMLRRLGREALARPPVVAPGAVARQNLPAKLRIDVTNASSCQAGEVVTAVKILEDDRLAIYQDSTQKASASSEVSESQARALLDYYREYGQEVLDTYFDGVGDIDGNGKVIVFVTPRASGNTLGYVWPGDLFSKNECPASNEAELIYLGVDEILAITDPDRQFSLALGALVHEMKHVSSVWERLQRDQGLHPLWLEEGGAEIASTRAARLAWEDAGGPGLTERVLEDDWRAPGSGAVTDENGALLLQLFRLQQALAEQPNSLLANTGNGDDIYGSGWLFLRWLGDAYGDAASGRHADANLFTSLNDRGTASGLDGVEAVTGAGWQRLAEEFVAALAFAGTEEQTAPARPFTSWDFIGALELWCFAVDPGAFEESGCPEDSGPGAPGALPWPVTTDPDGYTPTVDLRTAQTVPLVSDVYRGDSGQGGFRVHDFLTNGTGHGAEINVNVQSPARVVVVRIQ